MLRRYIESRERYFHGKDTSRVSLPFEWGFEFIGLKPQENRGSLHGLMDFASRTLQASDDFFSYEPTPKYSLDGETLRFPSYLETAYPENNTVWGRYFTASGDVAVVVLPQWNCGWDGHVRLCRLLQRAGIASVRLSLPYHHFRKPPHLQRPEYMVSSNLGQTLQATRQAVLDVRRTADWLLTRGYKKLAILGSSLGSCVAFLTFAHDDRFASGVFIHVSGYFADVVWEGLSTKHVRASLENHISLEQLRQIWAPISPLPYVRRLKNTTRRILMFAGRYDPTFLPRLSKQLFDEFDGQRVPYQPRWLPCGHYTMAQFPFSAVIAKDAIRFLRAEQGRR